LAKTQWPDLLLAMNDNLELLTKIQERIIECRRIAAETQDTAVSLFLYRLAYEVEAEAREADLRV
jgi:hypothetical protein